MCLQLNGPVDEVGIVRVLTVVDALRLGGAETLIAQLARVSSDVDLVVSVLSLHGNDPEHSQLAPLLQASGVEPEYLDVRRTLDLPAFLRLAGLIKEMKPDIVHAHLEMAITMALPAARIARTPAVATFHHVHRPLSGRARGRERLALEVATRSDATIFVSKASLQSFADRYRAGRPVPASWRIVHNGVDLDYFTPSWNDTTASVTADRAVGGARIVTVLAALRDFKGIAHAIEAWPMVVARFPDAMLLLVGSGSEERSLRSKVSELAVTESVQFLGMRSDIPAILRASEVVLLPSVYGENLPTVLMEAGGCGRAVVASDVGGISDIVADGETGLLVPPGDATAIADALITLLENPALAARLGASGRQRMERLFDARLWARSLRSVYEEVIALRQRRGRVQ